MTKLLAEHKAERATELAKLAQEQPDNQNAQAEARKVQAEADKAAAKLADKGSETPNRNWDSHEDIAKDHGAVRIAVSPLGEQEDTPVSGQGKEIADATHRLRPPNKQYFRFGLMFKPNPIILRPRRSAVNLRRQG